MRRHHARELFLQSLSNLKAAIEPEQARIKARNERTLELLPKVESAAIRFVRCGHAISGFDEELNRRATYLATATATGTAYQQARTEFISKIPRPSRRKYAAETLKKLKHVAYQFPQNISELRSCAEKLSWVKNELPINSPLSHALIAWQAAAGDILDRAQLWAVDGCRYLRMISGGEPENPLWRAESRLLDDILNAAAGLAEDVLVEANAGETRTAATSQGKRVVQAKRSTQKGDARTKIISALTTWHKYDGQSCLKTDPVGNNELARMAKVAESTASKFFSTEFGGRDKYLRACRNTTALIASLKTLNGEFQPRHMLGGLSEAAAPIEDSDG